MIAALALSVLLLLPVGSADTDIRYAAPRSGPDPTTRPTRVDVSAESSSASDPSQSGAPNSRLRTGDAPVPPDAASQAAAPHFAPTGGASSIRAIRGWATHWDTFGTGNYAAAGPALRKLIGPRWKGKWVGVIRPDGRTVYVRLITSCACRPPNAPERLIDLSLSVFAQLAPPSRGVIRVTVTVENGGRLPAPPATDTAP